MQELIGRLSPLDSEATETLRIITYFDALMSADLGVDALARAAASLAGATVGVRTRRRFVRFTPSGERDQGLQPQTSRVPVPTEDAEVWIERTDAAHTNDAMLLERLAFAVSFALKRDSPSRVALDVALDGTRSHDERATALERVGLRADEQVRVIVRPAISGPRRPLSTVALTVSGVVEASVIRRGAETDSGPRGEGVEVRADALPFSFRTAELAFRLSDEDEESVSADRFGALLVAADDLLRSSPRHPDIEGLRSLDRRSRSEVMASVTASSVRAAATDLHMHHSTLQGHLETLSTRLGYDPRSPLGVTRYTLADLALRLSSPGGARS